MMEHKACQGHCICPQGLLLLIADDTAVTLAIEAPTRRGTGSHPSHLCLHQASAQHACQQPHPAPQQLHANRHDVRRWLPLPCLHESFEWQALQGSRNTKADAQCV